MLASKNFLRAGVVPLVCGAIVIAAVVWTHEGSGSRSEKGLPTSQSSDDPGSLLPSGSSPEFRRIATALLSGLHLGLPPSEGWEPLLKYEENTGAGNDRINYLGLEGDAVFFAACRWESKWVASRSASTGTSPDAAISGFDALMRSIDWSTLDAGGLADHFTHIHKLELGGDVAAVKNELNESCPSYARF